MTLRLCSTARDLRRSTLLFAALAATGCGGDETRAEPGDAATAGGATAGGATAGGATAGGATASGSGGSGGGGASAPEAWSFAFDDGDPLAGPQVHLGPEGELVLVAHGRREGLFDGAETSQTSAYLARIAPGGEPMSVKSLGVANVYSSRRMADGGLALTGWTSGTLAEGFGELFVARLDPSGAELWRTPESGQYGRGLDLGVDGAGDIVVSGMVADASQQSYGWDVSVRKFAGADGAEGWSFVDKKLDPQGAGPIAVASDGNAYVAVNHVLRKFDAAGVQVWEDAGASSTPRTMATDATGNLIDATDVKLSSISYAIRVRKRTPEGETVWTKDLESLPLVAEPREVSVDADGRIAVAGFVGAPRDWADEDESSVFVAVLDPEGSELFARTYHCSKHYCRADAVVLDGDALYLAGRFEKSLDLGSGEMISTDGYSTYVARVPIP